MGLHLKDTIEGICRKAIEDKDGNGIPETYLKKNGDAKDNTSSFTSADSLTPTAWMDAPLLTTGEKHSSILNKISTMFKNIRWLYKMLGTHDISKLGDGTVTSAISTMGNLMGVTKTPLNFTNIDYSYPDGTNAVGVAGAPSLRAALDDSTKQITKEVCKLNTDLVIAKSWKTSSVSFMDCTGETSGITVESFLDGVVSKAIEANTSHGDSFQSVVGSVSGPIFCALTVIHSTKEYYGGFAFTYSNRYQSAQFFCEGGLYGVRLL